MGGRGAGRGGEAGGRRRPGREAGLPRAYGKTRGWVSIGRPGRDHRSRRSPWPSPAAGAYQVTVESIVRELRVTAERVAIADTTFGSVHLPSPPMSWSTG